MGQSCAMWAWLKRSGRARPASHLTADRDASAGLWQRHVGCTCAQDMALVGALSINRCCFTEKQMLLLAKEKAPDVSEA